MNNSHACRYCGGTALTRRDASGPRRSYDVRCSGCRATGYGFAGPDGHHRVVWDPKRSPTDWLNVLLVIWGVLAVGVWVLILGAVT